MDAVEPIASPAFTRTAVYPLVGRQAEWQTLLTAWRTAGHQPRFVMIRGESGIGKTRLAEELADWCGLNGVIVVSSRCYAGEGRLADAPIAAWLKSDALQPAVSALDTPVLSDVARLYPGITATRPELPLPDEQLQSWQRLRFFESLTQAFRAAAPIVLLVARARRALAPLHRPRCAT